MDATLPVRGVIACAMAALWLWFIVRRNKWIRNGYVKLQPKEVKHHDGNSGVKHSHHPSSLHIIFGLGSLLFYICRLLKFSLMSRFYEETFNTINNGIYILCFVAFFFFLRLYENASLKNCALFHFAIAVTISVEVCTWTIVTVSPLWTVRLASNSSSVMINNSVSYNVLETVEGFLNPFFIEYLIMSMGIIFNLWKTMRFPIIKVHKHPEESSYSQCDQEDALQVSLPYGSLITTDGSPLITEGSGIQEDTYSIDQGEYFSRSVAHRYARCEANGSQNTSLTRKIVTNRSRCCRMTIAISTYLLAGLAYLSAGLLLGHGPSGIASGSLGKYTRIMLYKAIQVCVYTPLFFSFLIVLHNIHKSSGSARMSPSLVGSDYLLLSSAGVNFFYFLMRAIAAAYSLSSHLSYFIFLMVFSILSIVQMWLQTQLLLSINYLTRSGNKISKMAKHCLIYLAFINISEWLQMSLTHEWIKMDLVTFGNFSPDFSEICNETTQRVLVLLLSPFLVIYRFHSAALALEILTTNPNSETAKEEG